MTNAISERAALPRLLFVVGAALALSYTSAPLVDLPFPGPPIWKASGIVLLGLYALASRARIAAVALFLSAVGDVALELQTPQWIAGMAAFGLAHVFYTVCFADFIRRQGLARSGILFAIAILAISIALLVWLYPGMGELTGPSIGYQAIITTMVMTAMVSRAPMITRIAAVVFMLSDTLIAVGLYRGIAVPPGSVWITYAVAQILLARGFATAKR